MKGDDDDDDDDSLFAALLFSKSYNLFSNSSRSAYFKIKIKINCLIITI